MRYRTLGRGYNISFGGPLTPGVKWLLGLNIGLFLLFSLLWETGVVRFVFRMLQLMPADVLQVWGVYQLVTYLFLHDPGGLGHVLFNMLALWMFGGQLESTWGTRKFLQYYLVCGAMAGLCVVVANALMGDIRVATIGASGAIYAVLLAFGMLFPNVPILLFFLFPIPAKYFVMIIGAIDLWMQIKVMRSGGGSAVSYVAHLGGLLFGFLYLRFGWSRLDLSAWARAEYRQWKVRRAKRRFEVYMRKQDSRNDRIH